MPGRTYPGRGDHPSPGRATDPDSCLGYVEGAVGYELLATEQEVAGAMLML